MEVKVKAELKKKKKKYRQKFKEEENNNNPKTDTETAILVFPSWGHWISNLPSCKAHNNQISSVQENCTIN